MRYISLSLIVVLMLVQGSAAAESAESGALPDPLQAGWQGKPVCERLFEDEQQRILRCTFPPATGHERHFHRPNFGYALEGGRMQLTDESGVREVELPTDSSFDSDGTDWHEVLNVGDTTVIYLIVEQKYE